MKNMEKKTHDRKMCPECDGSGLDVMCNVCTVCRGEGTLTAEELTAYEQVSFADIDDIEETNW
jgi:DnaJ-class molecular chaperone